MKKGFIELIENNTVIIFFLDNTKAVYPLDIFPKDIKVDMQVMFDEERLISISPPDEAIVEEIKKLSKELFIPFKSKKK